MEYGREYGRMVKVTPPASGGEDDEAVLYIVATGDPDEAMRLVRKEIGIGSKIEDVGRVSQQLLVALWIEPGEVKRI
jgi:hypothetical protein